MRWYCEGCLKWHSGLTVRYGMMYKQGERHEWLRTCARHAWVPIELLAEGTGLDIDAIALDYFEDHKMRAWRGDREVTAQIIGKIKRRIEKHKRQNIKTTRKTLRRDAKKWKGSV